MATTSENGKSDSGGAAFSRRLSDADLKAADIHPVRAYVRGTKKGETTKAAKNQNKWRKSLIKDQHDQFNVITSVFPDKRATITHAAERVWQDDYQDAIDAVIADDPISRRLVLLAKDNPNALEAAIAVARSPEIVERGLRTSEKDVCRLVDAVLDREDVRALLFIFLGRAEDDSVDGAAGRLDLLRAMEAIAKNPILCRSLATNDPTLLEIIMAITKDSRLLGCVKAMIADPELKSLSDGICLHPQLRRAAEVARNKPTTTGLFLRLALSTSDVLGNVAIALQHPGVIEVGKRATVSKDVRRAVEIAIAYPRATRMCWRTLSLPLRWGRLVRKFLGF